MTAFFEDIESGERYDIVGDRVIVGCAQDPALLALGDDVAPADIGIGDTLAPHHFAVRSERADGGRFFVEDLESEGGTAVNDSRITGEARLGSGDVVRAGGHRLLFVSDARTWQRVGSWLAFAPLTGAARGWRAIPAAPLNGAHRLDVVRTEPGRAPELPDHPSVPRWLVHARDGDGAAVAVREEVAGPCLARLVTATRDEGATLPEAAAVLILGEIAGALVGVRSLVDKPNVALSLRNIVITWEGRVRLLAFSGHSALPRWYAPHGGEIARELTENGALADVHMRALGCVALELLGHDVRTRGVDDAPVAGPLGAFARRCMRLHMNIDQARAELISIANELGFYPATELAALARRLFAVEHAREMELREELALLDDATAAALVDARPRTARRSH